MKILGLGFEKVGWRCVVQVQRLSCEDKVKMSIRTLVRVPSWRFELK